MILTERKPENKLTTEEKDQIQVLYKTESYFQSTGSNPIDIVPIPKRPVAARRVERKTGGVDGGGG